MEVHETEQELILQERPYHLYVVGAVLVGVAVAIFVKGVPFFVGIVDVLFLSAGLYLLATVSMKNVTVNAQEQTVDVRYRTLLHKKTARYGREEIASITLRAYEQILDKHGERLPPQTRIFLEKKNGTLVALSGTRLLANAEGARFTQARSVGERIAMMLQLPLRAVRIPIMSIDGSAHSVTQKRNQWAFFAQTANALRAEAKNAVFSLSFETVESKARMHEERISETMIAAVDDLLLSEKDTASLQ